MRALQSPTARSWEMRTPPVLQSVHFLRPFRAGVDPIAVACLFENALTLVERASH